MASNPQPISTWLESATLSSGSETAPEGKREAILLLLGKLALHYWRPDFTPSQAMQLYGDYADDLCRYAVSDVDQAIKAYRRAVPPNKFYPSSGQLIEIIIGKSWGGSERDARRRCELEMQRRPPLLSLR